MLRHASLRDTQCLRQEGSLANPRVEADMVTVTDGSNLNRVNRCIAHWSPQATACLASILSLLCVLGFSTCVSRALSASVIPPGRTFGKPRKYEGEAPSSSGGNGRTWKGGLLNRI